MRKIISKYKGLTFEDKTTYITLGSIFLNILLAIAKFLLAFFFGVFFLVAGIINVLISASKSVCYFGIKDCNNEHFEKRTKLIAFLLSLAGIQYIIYMLRLVIWNQSTMNYDMILGICIATVSFIELGVAIYGLFKVRSKGHYYRNIKIINFTSALSAIMLTMIAILSFSSPENHDRLCGICGMFVGLIMIILAIFIYYAPRYSIIDKEFNEYKLIENKKTDLNLNDDISIVLADTFWYGGYIYKAEYKDNKVSGHIIRTKSKISSINIYIKILLIVLSEILIFVYAGGFLVFAIKNMNLIKRLDKIMLEKNFENLNNHI